MPEVYEEANQLTGFYMRATLAFNGLSFPNYELFADIDKAYENFIRKVMVVIDNLAPSKNQHINGTSKNWLDAEIWKK